MKKLILINGIHEYSYAKKGDKHILYHSLSNEWSEDWKGKVCFEIEETPDGFILPSTVIDDSEAEYLWMLLKIAQDSGLKREIKVINNKSKRI